MTHVVAVKRMALIPFRSAPRPLLDVSDMTPQGAFATGAVLQCTIMIHTIGGCEAKARRISWQRTWASVAYITTVLYFMGLAGWFHWLSCWSQSLQRVPTDNRECSSHLLCSRPRGTGPFKICDWHKPMCPLEPPYNDYPKYIPV